MAGFASRRYLPTSSAIDPQLAPNSSLRPSRLAQAVNRCLQDFDELSRVAQFETFDMLIKPDSPKSYGAVLFSYK
jgi:hypothetical protein